MRKIKIETRCEPFMYNTYNDLNKIEIGNILTLKFGKKPFRVKKEYVGKEVKFIVNNFFEHNWRRPTRRLALIPIDKVENFKDYKIQLIGKDIEVKPEAVSMGEFFVFLNKKDIVDRKVKLEIGVYSNGKKIKKVKTNFLGPIKFKSNN